MYSTPNCLIHRVFAIVLLFTPSLGLFDTLHHGRLAALPASDGQREFDISVDGSKITFHEAWEPFKTNHISHFLEIPVIGVVIILTLMIVFHIFGSICILRLMRNQKAIPELLLEGFHALISPPLHIDWEMFYRDSEAKQSIKHCWRRLAKMTYG